MEGTDPKKHCQTIVKLRKLENMKASEYWPHKGANPSLYANRYAK